MLNEKWKLLETGSTMQAGDIANYIRGAGTLAKINRPKEYEELKVLIVIAKQIAEKKNRMKHDE
jgi:hypothetical protein